MRASAARHVRWVASIGVLFVGCGDEEGSSFVLCCGELQGGGVVAASIGGTEATRAKVQITSDLGALVTASVDEMTASCRGIALELGASPSEVAAVESALPSGRREAVLETYCGLAERAFLDLKRKAGAFAVTLPTATCEPLDEIGCDASCAVAAVLRAPCSVSPLVVGRDGVVDVVAAAKIRATVEGHVPRMLVLRARLDALAARAGPFQSTVREITEIKAACIPRLQVTAQTAFADARAASDTVAPLLARVQAP